MTHELAVTEKRVPKLSETIDMIAQAHKTRLGKFVYGLACIIRRWKNRPIMFYIVYDEGEPVGEEIEVFHLTHYDMCAHAARGALTKRVMLDGLRANAFEVVRYEDLSENFGRTIIQPRWVPYL